MPKTTTKKTAKTPKIDLLDRWPEPSDARAFMARACERPATIIVEECGTLAFNNQFDTLTDDLMSVTDRTHADQVQAVIEALVHDADTRLNGLGHTLDDAAIGEYILRFHAGCLLGLAVGARTGGGR